MKSIIDNIWNFIKNIFSNKKITPIENSQKKLTVKTLCVGVENGFAGLCPGALKDAKRMNELLHSFSSDSIILLDKDATKENFVSSLKKCIDADLLVLYYSGHGGQLNYSLHPEFEIDGNDEYLCLFDQPFIDDDLWELISKAKKSFIMFDCCHSQTMFRTSENDSQIVKKEGIREIENKVEETNDMIVWSGCPDNTYSYGDNSGGKFTNSFLANFKSDRTYDEVWKKIKNDKDLAKYEDTQQTIIGKSFVDEKMFTV